MPLTEKRMAVNKVLLLAWILLFAVPGSTSFPRCCHQRKCQCKLYELLFGSGNHAAGILTLGKRGSHSAKPFGVPFLVDAERQAQPVANGVGGFPDIDARQRSLSSPGAIREPRLQDLPSVCDRLFDRLVKCLALERTRGDGSTRGQCDSYARLCGNLSLVF